MKCAIAVFLSMLMLFLPVSHTWEAPVPTLEDQLLTVAINGVDYRLGVSTVEDLAANGWTYDKEEDGTFSFLIPEEESWFYVTAVDADAASPIVSINLMWASGLSVSYCGFNEDGVSDSGVSFWDWLTDNMGAKENEEGTLQVFYPLSDGRVLLIETKDALPCLTRLSQVQAAMMMAE